MKMRILLVLLALLPVVFSTVVEAEIYKWTDAYGHVHFSNTPFTEKKSAQRVELGSDNAIANPNFNMQRIQVPYLSSGGNMIVRGQVNGVAMDFVVDTGASFVSIPPSIAKKAKISTVGAKTVALQTANGLTKAPLVTIGNLAVGRLKRSSIVCTVQSISATQEIGLLGMSFLSHYRMTVDQKNGLLLLEMR